MERHRREILTHSTNVHLQNRLENCARYDLTAQDRIAMQVKPFNTFLFDKITSGKYRKKALTGSAEERTKTAIEINTRERNPIQFVLPFGGYKLHSLKSAPRVDWAEFMAIAYYSNWVAPIAAAYGPGVTFTFASSQAIMERANNIPKKDTDAYLASFRELLESFNENSPNNVRFEIRDVSDLYQPNELQEELSQHVAETRVEYANGSRTVNEQRFNSALLNIQWQGAEDWSQLDNEAVTEKIVESNILIDAFGKLKKKREIFRGPNKIIVYPDEYNDAIALGTTKNSTVKFWVGKGVLEEKKDGGFSDRILSPKQAQEAKEHATKVKTDLINMPNFKTIKIVKSK